MLFRSGGEAGREERRFFNFNSKPGPLIGIFPNLHGVLSREAEAGALLTALRQRVPSVVELVAPAGSPPQVLPAPAFMEEAGLSRAAGQHSDRAASDIAERSLSDGVVKSSVGLQVSQESHSTRAARA